MPRWDDAIRCDILNLLADGKLPKEIQQKYDGLNRQTIYDIKKKATSRGWVPGAPVLIKYVQNAAKSG